MKKKIITMLAVCALLLTTFTGCGNNTSSQTSTEASTTTAAPETTPEETHDATTTPEAVIDSVPEDDTNIGAENAANLADVVLNAVEWPSMGEQTEAFFLSDYFGLDITLLDDFCIQQNMMSTHLNEIVIVKPSEGNMDAVKTALNTHLEKLRTELAFYPAQLESANAAIVNEHNGYAYLICHVDAVTAEEALIEAINAL